MYSDGIHALGYGYQDQAQFLGKMLLAA
jgi:hypothetical protein